MTPKTEAKPRSSLRLRILAFVSALIVLSLLGSTISLYRITEVNRLLDVMNRVSVPLGRLFAQMQADSDLLQRELERNLGNAHWKDPHWRPRPVPRWIEDVLEKEIAKSKELIAVDVDWVSPEARLRWQEWADNVAQGLTDLRTEAAKLATALEQGDQETAAQIYPRWLALKEEWHRQVQWGASEYEQVFRQTFSRAETRVAELRTGLEMILLVVVALSLLLMWLGERALRPLGELTELAREITVGGLKKEHKAWLPEVSVARKDEVSQLAREFHNMATALLEREKMVETQKNRLQDQNRLLREMGELNENILNSIESVLIVSDLSGRITQCNPVACRFLGAQAADILDSEVGAWPKLTELFGNDPAARFTARKVGPARLEERVFGGHLMPLRGEDGQANGAVLVIEDLTEELDLQERLRRAENMAAVGRMSAQVAHEVRNPLHSIGLEAEMAAELASRLGHLQLKQSLQSILAGVDRLEKITENYLKLSRLSTGDRRIVDIGEVLEVVLATYAPVCEAQGIAVDWRREGRSSLRVCADRDLLEQVLGNLFRNALQAIDGAPGGHISWRMGNTETGRVWLMIEDNGPGVSEEVKEKLFTPFVTTRAQGTGLGLSFVKKMIEDHGGTVRYVTREGVRGACFEIVLPQVPEVSARVPQVNAIVQPTEQEVSADV